MNVYPRLPTFERTLYDALAESKQIVADAKAEHGPVKTWLMFSGGNDSMTTLDVCKDWVDGIAHVNTGIGVPETNEFAREQMSASGLPWVELHPPISYRDLVLGRWRGFPGPGFHGVVYQRLKERCVEQLVRESKTHRRDRVMLLTGVRRAESQRRMGYVHPVDRKGSQVWVNPLFHWSNDEMREYREIAALPKNPVAEHLHMSGECLCGAFANESSNREELEALRFFYPETAARIEALEAEVQAAGLPYARWGVPRRGRGEPGLMCVGCQPGLFEKTDVAPHWCESCEADHLPGDLRCVVHLLDGQET